MSKDTEAIERTKSISEPYKYGFVTDIDSDRPKKGLDEEIIKFISKKKNEPEWMLAWRLDCYKTKHSACHGIFKRFNFSKFSKRRKRP